MKNKTRAQRRRTAKARKVLLAISMVLVVAFAAVGGTIAWLTASTQTITNTFTTSDISITLTETGTTTDDDGNQSKSFQMIPGHTVEKDPKVTVEAGSEDCYVFVKLEEIDATYPGEGETEESYTFDELLEYAVIEAKEATGDQPAVPGWTKLGDNVWYRKAEAGNVFNVLVNDQVKTKEGVTKEQMENMKLNGATLPQLKISAYACQLYKTNGTEFEPEEAWNTISGN